MQVGNWVDLIRYRKNTDWDYATARSKVDFFTGRLDPHMSCPILTIFLTDREMIEAFVDAPLTFSGSAS